MYSKVLGLQNTSGLCKPHFNEQHNAWFTREARSVAVRRAFMARPEIARANGERLKAEARSAAGRARRRAHMLAHPKHHIAAEAAGPAGSPARMKAGRSLSARRLAHIPEDVRELYREMRSKGVPVVEAEAAALAHHERAMAAFRQRLMREAA